MAGPIERGLLTGFGALLFAQERAQEAVRDMIQGGRLAPEEGRRFMEDISARLEDDWREAEKRFGESMESAMRSAGLATSSDLNELKAHLAKIENRLDEIADVRPGRDSD